MTVASHVYSKASDSLGQKKIDIDSDTLKVMLLASYTPDQDAHQYLADVLGAGTETTGSGYTAGGATLGSVTWTQAGGIYTLDCADPSWGSALDAAYAVFYDATPGSDATRPLLCFWDLGGTQSILGLTINAGGLLTITAS